MANMDNRPLSIIRHQAGLHSVGSYQVAGLPWLTASFINTATTLTCSFPQVTKNITVYNTGAADVRVSFTDGGAQGTAPHTHYFTVPALTTGDVIASRFTFDAKCKKIFLSVPSGNPGSGCQVYAALTGINTSSMFQLTGPGLDD